MAYVTSRLIKLMGVMAWRERSHWANVSPKVKRREMEEFRLWLQINLHHIQPESVQAVVREYYLDLATRKFSTAEIKLLDRGRSAVIAIYSKEKEYVRHYR